MPFSRSSSARSLVGLLVFNRRRMPRFCVGAVFCSDSGAEVVRPALFDLIFVGRGRDGAVCRCGNELSFPRSTR